ncbi:MAG: hypothetical protein QXH57_05925 [Sulfolobales archaeon]
MDDESVIKSIVGYDVDVSRLSRVKEVSSESPHGIYVYDRSRDEWVLTSTNGNAFKPVVDGYYIIYFDNAKCHACRSFDSDWFPYIRSIAKKLDRHYFLVVLCEWFSRKCASEAASKTFKEYEVHASPTTYLIYLKNGGIVYKEKYEGRLNSVELVKVVEGFATRAEKFMRGEKVELPKAGEEVDITELIKKLIEALNEANKSGKHRL